MTETGNILLIDDDRSVREALGGVLRLEQFNVVLAANAEEALREFLRQKIDAVLLDLNLGQADGWETFDALVGLVPSLPILVMSGETDRLYSHTAAHTAAALMAKPIDISFLVGKLRDITESAPSAA